MIPAVISAVGGMIGNVLKNRQELSKATLEAKVARITNGIPGYSDEFLIFVWSMPTVMSFVPGLAVYAQKGFEIMNTYPDWYVGGFITLSFSVFGVDKLFAWRKV